MDKFEDLYNQLLISEGMFDRAKAKFAGAKQKVQNIAQGAKQKVGQAQAAVGNKLNNQNMVNKGNQMAATPQNQQTTGQAKGASLKKGLANKFNKELNSFFTQMQKALGLKSTQETIAKLKEISPETLNLYKMVQQMAKRISQ
jgi:hypothetical protein